MATQACTVCKGDCGILRAHYNDVIMDAMTSQIAVYSGTGQRKHQTSASLAFVRGIHRWPVNSPHKWPVTRKIFHVMLWLTGGVYVMPYEISQHFNRREHWRHAASTFLSWNSCSGMFMTAILFRLPLFYLTTAMLQTYHMKTPQDYFTLPLTLTPTLRCSPMYS